MKTHPDGHPMRRLIGMSAPLVTPFTDNFAVDWPRFTAHARSLLGRGMNVVTAFGTTGEGVSIPLSERTELYDRTGAAGISPSQLVECVYGPSSKDAGQHMRRSLAAGCAGILLTPPFYIKNVSDDGVFAWFAEVFETAGSGARDVILYNIPALTGVTIGAALTTRLREAFPDVIAGVKDSSGNWEHTSALLAAHRDLTILVGHEGHLAAAVRNGAAGAISGISNIGPALVAKLVRGEDAPIIDEVLKQVLALPVVPAIKAVLAAQTGDVAWRRVRAPLMSLSSPVDLAACAKLAATLT
jgi:4-hydroxy-tetrahydrodipicolinate synthase